MTTGSQNKRKKDRPCRGRKVDLLTRIMETRRIVHSSLVQCGIDRVGRNWETERVLSLWSNGVGAGWVTGYFFF